VSDPEPVGVLHLSGLSRNRLHRAAIHTLGDLLTRTEDDLLGLNGFGAGMLTEVTGALAARGMKLPGEPASGSGARVLVSRSDLAWAVRRMPVDGDETRAVRDRLAAAAGVKP
jgi:hypothetical protein